MEQQRHEDDKYSTSHLQQEERGFTKCPAERRLRCEMPAYVKPSHRTARGEGVIVNAQMCR
jgi:hypothetical protein